MIRARILFLPFLLLLVAADDAPPTALERIAKLRSDRAEEHADLGAWAAGKGLGLYARAHYLAAIHLDPECRKARSRLRHRRDGETWDTSREKEFEDKKGAIEKYGEEFAERERELIAEEAAAFEELGLELKAEGQVRYAPDLMRHAYFLDPRREKTAAGLGLAPVAKGFARPEIAKTVLTFSRSAPGGGARFVGAVLGIPTVSRSCGSVIAELPRDEEAAGELAVLGQRAIVLTCGRFGVAPPGNSWVWFVATDDMAGFERFLRGIGVSGNDLAICLQIGTARFFRPRHFMAVAGNGRASAFVYLHSVVESVLWTYGGNDVPAWLLEAVGVDANATLLGIPGTVCVVYEESQGLVMKDQFDRLETWPSLLARRAAVGDLPKFEYMRTAQVQALGLEDIMAAHAYYRLLLLTHPNGLPKYLAALAERKPELEAFESAFRMKHEELTKELERVLLGGE